MSTTCSKCGHKIIRDWGGWTHAPAVPMSAIERRALRHVIVPEDETPAARLEYLRGELRAERISQGELIELADLAPHIDPDDVELLEPAGVPEHGAEREAHRRQWNVAHHVATD